MKTLVMVVLACSMLAGCDNPSFLQSRTDPDRPVYGKDVIHVEIVNPDPRGPGGGVRITEEVAGTWSFTVPQTVTQVERRTNDIHRYSLFSGIPAANDVPFMTITVTRDRTSFTKADPEGYKVANYREFVMNGNIAQEWTGLTSAGAGFCELIIRRPGTAGQTGDVCHAMAHARNDEEQKTAVGILASITWKPQ